MITGVPGYKVDKIEQDLKIRIAVCRLISR
jgi:hypothetical protein